MKKKDDSKVVRGVADSGATTAEKSLHLDSFYPYLPKRNPVLLTSALGTQPLLTGTSPAYPIIKSD